MLALAQWKGLLSSDHFSVDGTLIEAWASMKRFVPRDGSGRPPEGGGRNPTVNFKGEKRSNDTHHAETDPDARIYKKSKGDKSQLCYMSHALVENRNGLVVDGEATHASGTAEREAAKRMVARSIKKAGATLGADKGYDVAEFVQALRKQKISPHVAAKDKGSAIDARTTRHVGYKVSIRKRKLVEEVFGWAKVVGQLRKAPVRGLEKIKALTLFNFAAYNLTRMATIFGWRLSSA